MEKSLVTYKIAKKLFKKGYSVGSHNCITQYAEDYVYDEDPDHPESHKKGEIGCYNFYHKNEEDENNLFEQPYIYDAFKWLREKYNIFCSINIANGNDKYCGEVMYYECIINKLIDDDKLTMNSKVGYNIKLHSYEECEMNMLRVALDLIEDKYETLN